MSWKREIENKIIGLQREKDCLQAEITLLKKEIQIIKCVYVSKDYEVISASWPNCLTSRPLLQEKGYIYTARIHGDEIWVKG